MDIWDRIETDRVALADYLDTLTAQDWDAQSWCDEWSVKDVALHLLVSPTMSKGKIFGAFLGSGFNLDKMSAKLIKSMTASMSTAEVAATTRSSAGVRSAPPGLKPIGVFAEVLVHSSDISLALGRPLVASVEDSVIGLEHMKDVQPVLGNRKRIAGLRMRATDADWSTGDGPLVEGPAQYVLAAMCGRRQALASLSGDGVESLRAA